MPEVLILNNIGNKGLSTDPAPWSLPPEFITFGRNFRIFAGSIITRGGEKIWSTAPGSWFPSHPIHVGSTSGDYWLVAGRDAIYAFDGVVWTDVSSVFGYPSMVAGDEYLWTSCLLGQIPIVNNPQAQPEYWAPQSPAQVMQPLLFEPGLTWKDKDYTFDIIRSHKNFLFALNLHEGGIDFPDSFRWSHPADINFLPPTWDEANPAFLAGKAALGGDGGRIIDGLTLRDAFAIYSEKSIDILDYTNDEFVWRRRNLSATVGLLAKNCIIEIKGRHLFLADGDIVSNDGTQIVSIAHNRIRSEITSRIDIDNYERSYAVRNDSLKEVWFCIPDSGDTHATIAYIYNWRDDSWAIKDLPVSDTDVGLVAYSGYGSQSDPADTWDEHLDSELWDNSGSRWSSAKLTPLDDTVVGANPADSQLIFMDPGGNADNDYPARIERTDYPLVDDRTVTTITRVYPHISGEATIQIQFGSQDYPGAPVRWKPAISFDTSTDRKIDLRTTGELHAWRFESLGKIPWRISGMTIEFERSGLR